MKTLALTSPLMRGPDVQAAQARLVAAGFYEGAVDGVYGPATAGAAREAKFRLGYARRQLVDTYGPTLDRFLAGTARPGPAMRARALARRRADDTAGDRLAAEFLALVGLVEAPAGSNRVVGVTDWYGIVGAWCAMVLTRAGVSARLRRVFERARRYAWCPAIVQDAESGLRGMRLVHRERAPIVPGLIALFDWDRDGVADHVGVTVTEQFVREHAPELLEAAKREHFEVIGRAKPSPGEFWTVEGNTSFGDDSNGGRCMLRIRRRSDLRALVRVTA